MSTQFPTINTFFQTVTPPAKRTPKPLNVNSTQSGNGFTSSEIKEDFILTPTAWTPLLEYVEVTIKQLAPGPQRVFFTCKVVNIFEHPVESKSPQAAKGCLRVLAKDDTGKILIKLWYADTSYNIILGTVLSIWTTHIHPTASASTASEMLATHPAAILTSIFPERDNGCCIRVHLQADEKVLSAGTPPVSVSEQASAGLVSLETLASGGGELLDAKILVCVVAIGQPTTAKSKAGSSFTTILLGIRDTSTSTPYTLVLPQSLIASANTFILNNTILLITSPRLHPFRPQTLTLTSLSQIDIGRNIPESISLQKYILRETCPINQPFPDHLFDRDTISSSQILLQFTFATLTDFISFQPDQIYTGYLSVIIAQLNLTKLISKKQLFSMECCNMPLYANATTATCGQCGQQVDMLLNPNVIGELSDETGGISVSQSNHELAASPLSRNKHNRLLVHPQAFADLFGRTPEALAELFTTNLPHELQQYNLSVMNCLEQRLSWMRVILMIGWTGEWGGGRLAILRVVR